MNKKIKLWQCFGTLVLALGIILASACGPAATIQPTPTPKLSPVGVVQAYEDAYNRRDVPAMMALFAEDAGFVVTNWGVDFHTLPEIQKYHEFYSSANSEIHYTDCQDSAATISCNQTLTEDCVRAFGVDPIPGKAVFTITDNKIQKLAWDPVPGGLDKYDLAWVKFTEWFGQTYPEEWASLTSGEWLSMETGTTLSKRCSEFAEAQK